MDRDKLNEEYYGSWAMAAAKQEAREKLPVLNITSHALTDGQVAELGGNVLNMPENLQALWSNVNPYACEMSLTDGYMWEIRHWARIMKVEHGSFRAVVQGHAGLMFMTVAALMYEGFECLYACSERVSTEEVQPDGSTIKRAAFRHARFQRFAYSAEDPED